MKKSTMATVRWRNRPWLLSPWKTKLGNRPWRKYDEEIDHGYCTMEKSTWLLSPWKTKLGKRPWRKYDEEINHGCYTMEKLTMGKMMQYKSMRFGKKSYLYGEIDEVRFGRNRRDGLYNGER
ncbi:hypothetical protein L6452_32170 [Arctium lappa]|uniref:Uncharacterized protein n=1 Tax=Arctium lappa TaxID=4217 RepID=A0ACB8Z4G7_ARCLA|nr:hypothetical protein L6452_32170 [Arctium lappa]